MKTNPCLTGPSLFLCLASAALSTAHAADLYAARAQALQGVGLARSLVALVSDEYALSGKPLKALDGMASGPVGQIKVVNGRIDITFGPQADPALANKTLSLTPYETQDQHVIWGCGNQPGPPGLQLLGAYSGGTATEYAESSVDNEAASAACAAVAGFIDSTLYRGDIIRQWVAEALKVAELAQRHVAENMATQNDLTRATTEFNAQNSGLGLTTPHAYIQLSPVNDGEIIITFNNLGGNLTGTLVLTPNSVTGANTFLLLPAAIGSGIAGFPLAWACASQTNAYAAAQTLSNTTIGSLDAQYAPPECR
jgi:hypothetical protein